MLVLRRRDGQWLDVVHRSGDLLRVRVYDVGLRLPNCVSLAFDDRPRNFTIHRPERGSFEEVTSREACQQAYSGGRRFDLD